MRDSSSSCSASCSLIVASTSAEGSRRVPSDEDVSPGLIDAFIGLRAVSMSQRAADWSAFGSAEHECKMAVTVARSRPPTLVYFAPVPWDSYPQRPHFLVCRLREVIVPTAYAVESYRRKWTDDFIDLFFQPFAG